MKKNQLAASLAICLILFLVLKAGANVSGNDKRNYNRHLISGFIFKTKTGQFYFKRDLYGIERHAPIHFITAQAAQNACISNRQGEFGRCPPQQLSFVIQPANPSGSYEKAFVTNNGLWQKIRATTSIMEY